MQDRGLVPHKGPQNWFTDAVVQHFNCPAGRPLIRLVSNRLEWGPSCRYETSRWLQTAVKVQADLRLWPLCLIYPPTEASVSHALVLCPDAPSDLYSDSADETGPRAGCRAAESCSSSPQPSNYHISHRSHISCSRWTQLKSDRTTFVASGLHHVSHFQMDSNQWCWCNKRKMLL